MKKNIGLSGVSRKWLQGYRGGGMIVGVIDTGVMPHADFLNPVVRHSQVFYMGGDYDGGLDETSPPQFGHGTGVAGIIAGKNTGIAPDARIISYKVFTGMGECYTIDVAAAVDRAVEDGCNIINMSLDCGGSDLGVLEAAIKRAVRMGVLVIASAGNSGNNVLRYPAAFDDVVSVGAVDIEKRVALFSSRNGAVDLASVGVNVNTTAPGGGYQLCSGTSFAAPHVAGIAAIIGGEYLSRFGKFIPEPVWFEMLKMCSVDIGVPGCDPETGAGFCTFGLGREVSFKPGESGRRIDGAIEPIDQGAVIVNARTLVPGRHLAEPMGIATEWIDGKATFWG